MILYLNLLPNEQRKKITIEKLYRFLKREIFIILVLTFCLAGSVLYIKLSLMNEVRFIEEELAKNKESHRPYVIKGQTINQKIDNMLKIQARDFLTSYLLIELTKTVPSGITIKQVSLDSSKTLMIEGRHKKRDDLILFKERLAIELLDNIED